MNANILVEISPATLPSSGWRTYKKTKGLVALLGSILVNAHPRLAAALRLRTLEGDEPFKPDAMVCVGPLGDVWQQSPTKLLKKYNVTGITPDGWTEFTPKDGPDATVKAIQIVGLPADARAELKNCHWGEKQPDGTYTQYAPSGAWLVVLTNDPTDHYFIDEAVFANTYGEVA